MSAEEEATDKKLENQARTVRRSRISGQNARDSRWKCPQKQGQRTKS
ncbi:MULTISPECIES: hypothetical protein [Bacillaceae]|uniref:Uncharacterized protein n=1 Tax=Evansella alkalicola TaxID=745819 RepID=A0ABS6JSQ4_9BACI|nr:MULTISPECIES: hypothetical protein [Bacillaceae]MBU9721596.1 hypothetical protein [Bacillus alkalicola]